MGIRVVRATGEVFITAGLVLLLFVAYVLWGTGAHTARAQNAAGDRLESAWNTGAALPGVDEPDDPVVASAAASADPGSPSDGNPRPSASPSAPPADIPLGTGLARLRVPRFGADYQWVVGEGISREVLKDGPGHYPGTALPGAIGNFVVSGHRTTYGAPFGGAGELQPGDALVVETAKTWFTYRVTGLEIVAPTEVGVTLPVPNEPDADPTERLMTWTTCHPKYSAKERLIVYSELESRMSKAPGRRPAALEGR